MTHKTLAQRIDFLKSRSMIKIVYFIIGISFLTLSACEKEAVVVFVVEAPLQVYFDRFIDEAALRGLDVEYPTSQVDAHIGNITEPNVIGQCSRSESSQHAITIDQRYWRSANDLQREYLIFHELGHCVLGRDHTDDADTNDNCISIMSSGTGTCRVLYTLNNRSKLLDELFTE